MLALNHTKVKSRITSGNISTILSNWGKKKRTRPRPDPIVMSRSRSSPDIVNLGALGRYQSRAKQRRTEERQSCIRLENGDCDDVGASHSSSSTVSSEDTDSPAASSEDSDSRITHISITTPIGYHIRVYGNKDSSESSEDSVLNDNRVESLLCYGCIHDAPGQRDHMGCSHGCLHVPDMCNICNVGV